MVAADGEFFETKIKQNLRNAEIKRTDQLHALQQIIKRLEGERCDLPPRFLWLSLA